MPSSVSPTSRSAISRLPGRLLIAATMGILLCAPCLLRAQGSALDIEVEASSSASRTGGPVSLALRFDWRGAGVVDGQLLIELRDSENMLLGTFVLDDLYLTEGTTRQEFMLPGMNVHSMNDEVTLNFWLLDRSGGRGERLRPALLRIPGQGRRALAIAVYRPEFSGSDGSDIVDRLRLEALLPQYNTQRDTILVTRTANLVPDDAPADPLRLCTYDIVLLTSEGLSQLSEQQLRAVLAWTRAGGSVCLLVDRGRFDGPQLDFVNALLERDEPDPAFLLNSSGDLVYEAGEDPPEAIRSRCGLGRAVIVGLKPSSADDAAAHWPATSAFLWRLRLEHLDSVAARGVWDIDATIESAREFSENQNQYAYNWQTGEYGAESGTDDMLRMQATDMDPIPLNGGSGLLTRLMPGDIRVVPLWMIALMLVVYVGAIGPLDYFVLGRLGLRRLTWVSFPAVTLVFTLCSIAVSNSFLTVAADRKSLVIRDLDEQGVVTRENRLELLFPSRSRTMDTDMGRGLFCPLRHQDFSRTGYYYDPYSYQTWEQGTAEPARFVGRMPVRAIVSQRIGQWTPQLNRSFTIPLSEDPDVFGPLSTPELDALVRNGSDGAVVENLRGSIDHLVGIYLYGPDETDVLHGPQMLFQDQYGTWNQVYVNGQWESRQVDFLQELSMRRQPGFFGIVSQISPTGGFRFEDMALLDPTDENQRLLVVAVEEDRQLVLYRKLYVLDH